MAKDTIETIRAAELSALKIEKEAADKAETIISKAMEEAGRIAATMRDEVVLEAENKLLEARKQVERMLEEAEKGAEEAIKALENLAQENEQSAIDLVISELV